MSADRPSLARPVLLTAGLVGAVALTAAVASLAAAVVLAALRRSLAEDDLLRFALSLLLAAVVSLPLWKAADAVRRGAWGPALSAWTALLLRRLGAASHAEARLLDGDTLRLLPHGGASAHQRLHAARMEARWRPLVRTLVRLVPAPRRRDDRAPLLP
jgi:hypothetical protein